MRYIEKPLALFFFSTSLLTSQWWYYPNPYPSEKRFEDQSFYFSPTYVNPYGVDEFSSALSGIVDHPLMNLQINPAGITSADQNTYLYFDYRTNKDLARKNYAGIRPADQYVFGPILYPYYPGTTKLSVEPAFSSAVLGKLFPESIPELTLGISYELISQSEPFYPIENYISNPYAMETARDVSYDGIDQVRNTGHFIALFSGYRLTDDLSVGARLGRSLFERSGKYGPQVRSTSGSASSSFYSNDNDRGQDYHLWDASLGVQLQLSDRILIGATAGYFTGDVTQSELYRSINNSLYTASSLSYESVTDNTRNWKHTGNGFSLGANSRAHLTSTVTITASYTYSIQDRDLTLSANDKYDYTSVNQISPNDYRYGNYSLLKSYGNGSRALTGNRLAAALILKNERKLSFTAEVVYNDQSYTTATHEYVEWSRHTQSQSTNQPYTDDSRLDIENIFWNSDRMQSDLQIPVMLDLPLNDYVIMNLGFNRRFLTIEESEQNEILYIKREHFIDGQLQENDLPMYEQYNQPRISRTTNTMSLLAGFTVQPAEGINVRLLTIPYTVNRQLSLQWLAGVSIIP